MRPRRRGCGADERPRRSARLARARRGPDGGGGGGGEDRISGLPTDLLLQILLRLRCTLTAARAGLVSRRWRGLWELLPEIHLACFNGPASAALARAEAVRRSNAGADAGSSPAAALPPPNALHLEVFGNVSPQLAASLLRRAARLAPGELKLSLTTAGFFGEALELPCLPRTKSIELTLWCFCLLPPPPGYEIAALERLALNGCEFNAAALIPSCPCLRVLEVGTVVDLDDASREIHMPLHLSDLYKMELSDMGQLQELILFGMSGEPFGEPLHVGYGVSNFMQRIPQLRLLRINISLAPCDRVCLDHLEMLPMTSTLILQLSTYGHVFATMVLDLLQKVTGIEELTVLLKDLPEDCGRMLTILQVSPS
ncbi:hypothetical protein ACP4OV_009924 [Aristida adscensionis]